MNKIKFLQKVSVIAFFSLILVSCGASMQSNIQQTRVGMSRSEVISKLGNDFEVMSMSATPQGSVEVIRYTTQKAEDGTVKPDKEYILRFLNDKLVELKTIDLDQSHGRPSRPHRGYQGR